jgi:hypothetical protein
MQDIVARKMGLRRVGRWRLHDAAIAVISGIGSLRLAAQDVALSRRKQGFESPRERQSLLRGSNALLRPDLQLEHGIGGAMRELLFVGRSQCDIIEEFAAGGVGGKRIVDREHDAVDAEGL